MAGKIYEVAHRCHDKLEDICKKYGDAITAELSSANEVLDDHSPEARKYNPVGLHLDLQHWSGYTGALELLGESLDTRVRDAPEISDMFIGLLEMIWRNLSRIEKSYVDATANPSSADATEIRRDALKAIDYSINRLNYLGTAIRNESATSLQDTITDTFDEEDETFRRNIMRIVIDRLPGANSSLHEQISHSIAIRRKYMIKRLQRKQKPSIRGESQVAKQLGKGPQDQPETRASVGVGVVSQIQSINIIQESLATKASTSDSAAFQMKKIIDSRSKGSLPVTSFTSWARVDAENYPDRPKVKDKDEDTPCPYCLVPLKATDLEGINGDNYWRRHLDEDLRPYVCLFPQCPRKFDFFTHKKDWKAHLESDHSIQWPTKIYKIIWYCDLGHSRIEFNNETDWKTHVGTNSVHSGHNPNPPTESQLAALSIRNQEHISRSGAVCPLCEGEPELIQPLLREHQVSNELVSDKLSGHIADHLKALALLSLPAIYDENSHDCQSIRSDGSIQRLLNTGSEPLLPSEPDIFDRPPIGTPNTSSLDTFINFNDTETLTADTAPNLNEGVLAKFDYDSLWRTVRRETSTEVHNNTVLQDFRVHGSRRTSLEILYPEPNDPINETIEIDIIAVHGLGTNMDTSWVWRDDKKHVNWLKDRDMLPTMVPNARIMTYSYETRWPTNALMIHLSLLGEELARTLHEARAKELDRPILFIAHSLGGLVVIHSLLYANRTDDLKYLPLKTIGFVALGTPFSGTRMQPLSKTVSRLLSFLGSNDKVIDDLGLDDKSLREKVQEFCQLKDKLQIPSWCFIEQRESDYGRKAGVPGFFKGIVVEETSAHVPGWGRIGLNTDHFYLNKFSGPNDGSFIAVSREISLMYAGMHADTEPSRMRRKIEHNPNYDTEKRLKQVLDALYFEQIDARRQNVSLANPDTCSWILETTQYSDWVNSIKGSTYDNILWIKGKPGAGKSTMMKFLYKESTRILLGAKKISFFFNARGVELEKTTLGLYRALLWGILRKFEDLIRVFDDVNVDSIQASGWEEQHLKNLLEQSIEKLGDRPLVCYIDALDECPEDQIRLMVTHFRRISKRATESGSHFKLCFSSRHYPNISIENSISLILEEESQHEVDIRRYIDLELVDYVETVDRERAIRIQNKLLRKSSSVFLYVKLVVDRVKQDFDQGEADMKTLEGRLDELPQGLSALYREILTRNSGDTEDSEDREATRLGLQWVLFATSPLTPDQLYFAIQHGLREDTRLGGPLNDGDYETLEARMRRFIIGSSKGLVEIEYYRWPPTIHFIHESVRDFLLREGGYRELYPSLRGSFAGESHDKLKQICYKGVQLVARHREPGSEFPKSARLNPFLSHYAICGTLRHAEKAQAFGVQQRDFLSNFSVNTWIKAYRYFRPKYDSGIGHFDPARYGGWRDRFVLNTNQANSQLLYILAMANLPHLIRVHPDRARHLEIEGGMHGAPLVAAMTVGNHECVSELGLPASQEGKSLVFLDRGKTYPFHEIGESLVASCGNLFYDLIRLNCLPLVRVLADGKDLNRYEPGLGRPLSWAVYHRALDVIQWLLSHEKVDPMIQDYNQPIHCDVDELLVEDEFRSYYYDVDEWMLQESKEINDDREDEINLKVQFETLSKQEIEEGYGKSSLHHLCADHMWRWDEETSLKILRNFLTCPRIFPESYDGQGRTPFSYVVESGSKKGAQMLFETRRVDADSRSNCGRSPLSYAKHTEMCEWLLSLDVVDPNSRDAEGRTPLSHAAEDMFVYEGVEVFVKFGTSGKIDFDSRDNSGRTPLRWAANRTRYATIRLLLETGAVDPELKADDGLTPLDVIKSGFGDEARRVIQRLEEYVRKKRGA